MNAKHMSILYNWVYRKDAPTYGTPCVNVEEGNLSSNITVTEAGAGAKCKECGQM